jgi:putative CocE/NonD family hydrolase
MKKIILWIGLLIILLCVGAGLIVSLRQVAERRSLYVTMSDGTDIAIDVWLPTNLKPGEKIPTIMRSTCYWRSSQLTSLGELVERLGIGPEDLKEGPRWVEAGYALVLVDVRGSGASYGQWEMVWSEREIADLDEIMDWIIAQSWSNGKVGAYGVSYDGNTAELMASLQHPALKAVAPQYSDFDVYNGLVRPGGVFNHGFMSAWNEFHNGLGKNDVCTLEAASGVDCEQMKSIMSGVRKVDADVDGAMLSEAVSGHAHVDVYQIGNAIEFSDDTWGTTDLTLGDLSPYTRKTEIENSNVPMYVWVGWLDSATVDGALSRYMTFSNPQNVMIGPWSHGGGYHTDPFLPADQAVEPSVEKQFQMLVDFFDLYLKDTGNANLVTGINYYTLGEGTWKTTQTWPPAGFTSQTWYFADNGTLTRQTPGDESVADDYLVKWDAMTGELNRWYTGLFKSDVVYPDRAEEDKKLLTYTSAPLQTDVEITGNPVVTLSVAASTQDAAFHVYLEDVAPDGRVTYISEGILRAIHRKVSDEAPPYQEFGPYHTMARADALPTIPGEVAEISFKLYATSVLIKRGHQIRVAIAGHDGSTFERYPIDKTPLFEVQRNSAAPSFIVLPMQER